MRAVCARFTEKRLTASTNRVGHLPGLRKLAVCGERLRGQRDLDDLRDQYFSGCEEMEEKVRRNYEE